jgi:hypothetical protein
LIDLRRVMLGEWIVYNDTPPVVVAVPTPTPANAGIVEQVKVA